MTNQTISKCCILILGMHRSGTSALAGTLSILGLDPGKNLTPAIKDVNPKGFWENERIVDINERLLAAIGSSWNDERPLPKQWWQLPEVTRFQRELKELLNTEFSNANRLLIKDPRICRLIPLYNKLLEELGYAVHIVMILRDPGQVSRSLLVRDGIVEERSALLWLRHILEAERWTRDSPRIIVTYESLLNDWRSIAEKISNHFNLHLLNQESTAQETIDEFLEPTLQHHTSEEPSTPGPMSALAYNAYKLLTEPTPSETLESELRNIQLRTLDFGKLVAPWSIEIQAHLRHNSALNQRARDYEATTSELRRVKSTLSWKVTAPLRLIWNFSHRIALLKRPKR